MGRKSQLTTGFASAAGCGQGRAALVSNAKARGGRPKIRKVVDQKIATSPLKSALV